MDDDMILERGGTQEDIEEYANLNGADLTEEDLKLGLIPEESSMEKATYIRDWRGDVFDVAGVSLGIINNKKKMDTIREIMKAVEKYTLEELKSEGSGGGSWRRLIEQKLSKLK